MSSSSLNIKEYKQVLVLYAGGTIGMQKNEKGAYVPVSNLFLSKIKSMSDMHDECAERTYFRKLAENEFILPEVENRVIIYEIVEYSPLLDSSNMSPKDWIRIACDIRNNYAKYDSFVVLHGTDTMAYSASALSFLLEGLQKPVILTGSQIPIFETRSDAKENFLSSLIMAGLSEIPEVCIYFANKLLRGNRTSKESSSHLDAFNSPNYPPLAIAGIYLEENTHFIRAVDESVPFQVHMNLNCNVAILYLFPTITVEQVKTFTQKPTEGVIIQSYGVGNIPSDRTDLLEVLTKAIKAEILIINITQCPKGSVASSYEPGQQLQKIGIISGGDMTVEAAYTKLCYVLGIPGLSFKERVQLCKDNIRGEISEPGSNSNNNGYLFNY